MSIRVCVIGLGRIGKVHTEIYRTMVKDAKLVAVVDTVEKLARSLGERYHVKWYTDYDKALRDPEVDAVVVCTPTFTHSMRLGRC